MTVNLRSKLFEATLSYFCPVLLAVRWFQRQNQARVDWTAISEHLQMANPESEWIVPSEHGCFDARLTISMTLHSATLLTPPLWPLNSTVARLPLEN